MTREEIIAAIIEKLQDDTLLLKFFRSEVAITLPNVEDARLATFCALLGIPPAGP